jgi:hypothetical protein
MDFYTLSGGFQIWSKKQNQVKERIGTEEKVSKIITEYLSISNYILRLKNFRYNIKFTAITH